MWQWLQAVHSSDNDKSARLSLQLLRLNQSEYPADPLSFAHHETTMVDKELDDKAPMFGHEVGSSKRCNDTMSEPNCTV